jgi:hypothetical protein
MYGKSDIIMFILIYVDDIILISSSKQAMTALLHDLRTDFALKELGGLHFLLGIEHKKKSNVVLFTQ